jgi:hypothetical protein
MTTRKVTNALIRMYRMGTGDCFAIKFRSGNKVMMKMLIDAGVVHPGRFVKPYIEDLVDWFDGEIDVFAITHEHGDHVSAIEQAKDIFKEKLSIKKIWLAWTEDPNDAMAREWKDIMGKKKKALKFASDRLKNFVDGDEFEANHQNDFNLNQLKASTKSFSDSLEEFHQLHGVTGTDHELAGMKILKEEIADNNIEYYEPGDVVEVDGVEGLRFYILGPPRDLVAIKKEKGKNEGDAYEHNKELDPEDFLSFALMNDGEMAEDELPFSNEYVDNQGLPVQLERYDDETQKWRRIDHDWLMSAGSLAMRLTRGINNLSLVMAMEFEDTGKVMLFPGDAEIGSWESWHKIKWEEQGFPAEFTTDLLNRTQFYKVAHHLSHNGTAKEKGLELMTHDKLVAMATLSYHKISSRWKGTMPNRMILKELIQRTRGRFIVTWMKDLFYDLNDTIKLEDKVNATRSTFAKENKLFKKDFKNIEDENKDPTKVLFYEYLVRD